MKAEQKTVARGQRPVASVEARRSGHWPDGPTSRAALQVAGQAAELGYVPHAQRASSPGPWPLAPGPSRSAFTLVELMVTMAIIAILGAAMAYAVAGAQQSANIAKTRSLIAKLHSLVMQKYESYRTRRLPISIPPFVLDPTNGPKDSMNNPIPIPTPARAIALVRCDAIRQLMRMEMPERWTDVIDDPRPITVQLPGSPPGSGSPRQYYDVASATPDGKGGYRIGNVAQVTMQRPSCSQAYLALYTGVYGFTKSGNDPPAAAAKQQAAKCLYLLITMGLDDPDALENFSQQDIVDFDKSGCKEFVDAWGNPIWFLRWAPGMVSALQPDAPTATGQSDQRMRDLTDPTGVYGSPQSGTLVMQPATSGQTSGRGRVGGNTFALYPLIFSAGPDGNYDTVAEWFGKSGGFFHYASTNPLNNPFASVSDTTNFPCAVPAATGYGGGPFGAPFCDPGRAFGNFDNITNQDIGAR
jgi:prepilin-type N-terminal cleavage/methylation domain-containing protein